MISLRGVAAISTILLCVLPVDGRAQANSEQVANTDAKAVLGKARDTYRTLAGYHFERVLLVQEAMRDGKQADIAELTLDTATENAQREPSGKSFPPLNLDRLRLGTKTKRGEMLQVCDGRTCWSFTSLKNEYMTGNTFMDVNMSVGGSILMALHLFTFATLEDGTLQDAKVVRQEEVDVAKERRKCYVVEGEIQAPLPPGASNRPPAPSTLGLFWFVSMLTLQGLADEGRGMLYSPWLDEKAHPVGEPTRVTLWIDEDTHVIVRSKMSAQLYKRIAAKGEQAVEKVAVTVTESFTTAAVKAPSADLFRFTPPEGATEVPNVASRRGSRRRSEDWSAPAISERGTPAVSSNSRR